MRPMRVLAAFAFSAALALPGGVLLANAAAADTCSGDPACSGTTLTTPAGPVTIRVNATGVATIVLTPISRTLVYGVPFPLPEPPIAGCPGGCTRYARSSIDTAAGFIVIDTIVYAPGSPGFFFTPPNLALVSIHPPSPCRATTVGNTVTFTPIA